MGGSPPLQGDGGPRGARLDWADWHAAYDRPASPLARRLALVQRHLRGALDTSPPGPLRAVSVCAGQGHDLIGVLSGHPRREEVTARLVELDPGNVRAARAAVAAAGLERVEVVEGDASAMDSYLGAVPAHIVLVCGVLGNISVADVQRTVRMLPRLCAPAARVIWTRRRDPPDLLPELLRMFDAAGFEQTAIDAEPDIAVATSVLRRAPDTLLAGARMFDFIGQGALWPHLSQARRSALQALFRPDCSIVELVEAMRALPAGGPDDQSAEAMLREGQGTPAAKHRFLREVLQARFPETRPTLVHRLYTLRRDRAEDIYGAQVAAAVPAAGIEDVHTYLTVTIGSLPTALDVTLPGPGWDGHSPLPPVCGPGEDRPDGTADALPAIRETPERRLFLAARAVAGLPQSQPEP